MRVSCILVALLWAASSGEGMIPGLLELAPSDDGLVDGSKFIVGTAGGGRFKGWTVRAWPAGRTSRIVTLAASSKPAIKGMLAMWDTTACEHGRWYVELSVESVDGRVLRVRHAVVIGRPVFLTRVALANSMAEPAVPQAVVPADTGHAPLEPRPPPAEGTRDAGKR